MAAAQARVDGGPEAPQRAPADQANRPEHGGTATGVCNFVAFSMSALLGPILGNVLMKASGGGERGAGAHQAAFSPLLVGVALAVVLALFLRETGAPPTPHQPLPNPPQARSPSMASQVLETPRAGDERAAALKGVWQKEIDVRDFIHRTSRPTTADEAFLAGPTDARRRSGTNCRRCSRRSSATELR